MFKISCIQLRSSNNIKENLKKTTNLIIKAINKKTDLIITPEASSIMSENKSQLLNQITSMDLTQNPNLSWVFGKYNQLHCLNIKNGNNVNLFFFSVSVPSL